MAPDRGAFCGRVLIRVCSPFEPKRRPIEPEEGSFQKNDSKETKGKRRIQMRHDVDNDARMAALGEVPTHEKETTWPLRDEKERHDMRAVANGCHGLGPDAHGSARRCTSVECLADRTWTRRNSAAAARIRAALATLGAPLHLD